MFSWWMQEAWGAKWLQMVSLGSVFLCKGLLFTGTSWKAASCVVQSIGIEWKLICDVVEKELGGEMVLSVA